MLTADQARAFLATRHRGVFTTFRADGRPQLSPVLAALDGAGRVVLSTTEGRAKARNVRRDPRVALCVMEDGFFGSWVQVEGTAELLPPEEALDEEALRGLYGALPATEPPSWDEFRAAVAAPERVVVRFAIERASGVV
ncbi:PPOX class F420-dependent oxidoreductase [Allostreptomyces psammosilenae]|uniref:PPOX class probable F420-dependent enzyme n=1 Tax=Allostreptomyces psammosilenae TaxID=1892865 RepID=A0A853AD42_9ACTN|nr:PPOX class F420-dependent oxidoreductase [Allostreptomyces psammosilenae]NYI08252.1 PPOX class probable F420-dependent enzyme [Allostreptomyces psammosilenae]